MPRPNVSSRLNETTTEELVEMEDRFQWDESEQGLVLGVLYWLHWATQLPGGLLAQKYGARKVFGLAQLVSCLLCFVIPPASYFNLKALLIVRLLQGVVAVHDRFQWDESEQGLVLGAFYWLHWVTQLPGGLLAQKIGAKKVFGLTQLISCLLCFVIPPASYFSLKALLIGFTWPAMHTLTGKWIPPNERSKFLTTYLGSSVGAAVTYPACGILIDWFGWESVFYVSGLLGVLWYTFWHFLVFDSPREHPRVTDKERKYIEDSLGSSSKKEKLQTPWKAILTSLPLWMNICAQWGGLWGLFTVLTHAPTYFKMIHGWDMRAGAMFIALAMVGCDSVAAIILVTATTGIHGAVSTGPLASLVDISPNFAGVLFGICITVSSIPGFLSPIIVGFLTLNNQTVGQWQIIFLISGGMCVVCGLLHLIFSESEVQWWNSPDSPEKGEILQPLT